MNQNQLIFEQIELESEILNIKDKNILIEITNSFLKDYSKERNNIFEREGFVPRFFRYEKKFNIDTKKFEDIKEKEYPINNEHIINRVEFFKKYFYSEAYCPIGKKTEFNKFKGDFKDKRKFVLYYLLSNETSPENLKRPFIFTDHSKENNLSYINAFKDKINDETLFLFNIFTLFKYSEKMYNRFLDEFIPDSIDIQLLKEVRTGFIIKNVTIDDYKDRFKRKFPYQKLMFNGKTLSIQEFQKECFLNDNGMVYRDMLPSCAVDGVRTPFLNEFFSTSYFKEERFYLLTYMFLVYILEGRKKEIHLLINKYQYEYEDINHTLVKALNLVKQFIKNGDMLTKDIFNKNSTFNKDTLQSERIKDFIKDFNIKFLLEEDKKEIRQLLQKKFEI